MRSIPEKVLDKRLLPREHGAIAQLAFPLASGLALGSPTLAAVGFAVSAVLLFLAHEPLAILMGFRGARLLAARGAAARRQLVLRLALGVVIGAAAFFGAPPQARWLALVPAVFAAALVPAIMSRRLKSLGAETVVIAAFAALHLPVGAASGLEAVALWGPPGVWVASFVAGTLAVHAIKARQMRRDPWLMPAARAVTTVALASSLAVAAWVPGLRALGVATAIPAAAVLAVNLMPVGTKSLKRIGWALAAASLASLVVLLAAYRS